MSCISVTGGTDFVGSVLLQRLLANRVRQVSTLVREPEAPLPNQVELIEECEESWGFMAIYRELVEAG